MTRTRLPSTPSKEVTVPYFMVATEIQRSLKRVTKINHNRRVTTQTIGDLLLELDTRRFKLYGKERFKVVNSLGCQYSGSNELAKLITNCTYIKTLTESEILTIADKYNYLTGMVGGA